MARKATSALIEEIILYLGALSNQKKTITKVMKDLNQKEIYISKLDDAAFLKAQWLSCDVNVEIPML